MSYKVEIREVTEEDTRWPEGRLKLIIFIDDGKEISEHWDGGEPEDQTFDRNWSWVKPALEQAYQQGLKDAKGQADAA